MRRNSCWRVHTWMGAFNAASPKGTVLWSSRPSIRALARNLPSDREWTAEMTHKSTDASGKTTVCGAGGLKGSQAYTAEFGKATLHMWKETPFVPQPDLRSVHIPDMWVHGKKQDRWEDANLCEVMQYLSLK